jgi:D-mannonate dehydratase
MYVGSRLSSLDDVEFTFLQQLGIRYVRFDQWPITMSEPGSRGVLKADEVRRIQEMVRPYGLQLAIFLLPQGRDTQYWHARFGRSAEADAEIDNVCETIRVLGGAEVPVCEWTWSVPDVFGRIAWPTNTGRGGARVSRFDYDLIANKRPEYAVDMNAEQMWDNLIYFMEKILPVAEQAGTDVLALIRYFGERDRVNHVHFRNVKGSVPVFDESFIDDGDVDMFEAIKVYQQVGYQYMLNPDHHPGLAGDENGRATRAYALGYIKALLHAIGEL